MPTPHELRLACKKALSEDKFSPIGGMTFCNQALLYILDELEIPFPYNKKSPPLANIIYDIVSKSRDWVCVDAELAFENSKDGGVSLALQRNEGGNGHCVVMYPEQEMVFSCKWQKKVGFCLNVGKTNGIMSINFAFSKEPEYFVYGK